MSRLVDSLMWNWLKKRRVWREAEVENASVAELARLEREVTRSFAAWRDAVRALDQAA